MAQNFRNEKGQNFRNRQQAISCGFPEHDELSLRSCHAQKYYLLNSLNYADCGDFCGDSSFNSTNFSTSQTISAQAANDLTKKGLQGFLSSVQQHSEMVGNGFQDRCTGETAVSTKRGFESSTSWCSAGDIQCRILHLKPGGLLILTTTRDRIFEQSA